MPTWNVKGQQLMTADIGAQAISQKFKLTKSQLLLSVKTWLVLFNDPFFTDIFLELWSDDGGTPRQLIHSSSALTKSQLLTLNSGVKEGYFDFNSPYGVPLRAGTWYHTVVNAHGYTGDELSHIAWMKGWPDPVYDTNYTPTFENLSVAPYALSMIGAKIR